MQIHELKTAIKESKKRVGRGGKKGTYSGKGMKGQRARAGYSSRPTFSSSIVTVAKKIRGFKSLKPKNQVVSLDRLELKFENGELVNSTTLKERGLIRKEDLPVKIVSNGNLSKALIFEGLLFTKQSKDKIEKAKGEIK